MTCRTCPVMRLCCHRLRSSPSSYSSYQVPSFSPCKMLIIQPILKTRVSWSLEMASVQFSHSLISDSLRLHGLQDPKLPFPSRTPRACSNSCPLSQWCHPTISSSVIPFSFRLQSFPVFSNESVLHIRWPKYRSFSFSIGPSNEYSGLISFKMDWFDLLAVQGTLKSLLQHHSSKASILQHSAFFMVQLSHPHKTTGKTIALTRQTFVSKVMSLLFNILSRLVIVGVPLWLSW